MIKNQNLIIFCFFVILLFGKKSQTTIKNEELLSILLLVEPTGQEYITLWIQNLEKIANFVLLSVNESIDIKHKICDFLPSGINIIIDVTWPGNEEAQKIASDVDIPYIKIDISISPHLSILDKYIEYKNSTDVTVIFDKANKVDEALYFWIDTSLLRMVISESLDRTSANRVRKIRPVPNNFALIASTTNMEKMFQFALAENLVSLPERWNLVFLDFNYENFNSSLISTLPVNILYIEKQICCELFEKIECQCSKNFNLQKEFFVKVVRLLIETINNLVKQGLELHLNCDNIEIEQKYQKIFYNNLKEISLLYNFIDLKDLKLYLAANGSIKISNDIVAQYNHKNGITIVDGKTVKKNTPFYRIGVTHAIPWSYKKINALGKEYWVGYCVDFTKELAKLMGFRFEFVEPENGSFGKKINGVWNGVIGDLFKGETDMAVTALIMTADREEVVDYVAPYFEQTGITIVMRKPIRKTSLFKFMTVLKLEVWLSIVGALVVTGFMIWILDKYSPYSARNNKNAYPYPCREFTLKESFWFALTSFTPQGGGEAPKALSGRTLVAAYWLFVVLMLATFTANLAAFLTVERMQTPVQSLEQLAKQSRINYTVVQSSDTHSYFINMKHAEDTLYRMWKELTLNTSTDDTQYRVWDYPIREQYGHILIAINDSNPVPNASEGFRMVDEHTDADFAFIHDSSEIKYEITKNCNLTEVGEVFAERPYAIAVQQGSHLQDEISKTILNLQKNRFFEQLQAKYWNHSSKGSCLNTDDNEGITLESLGGVFIATLFGLALAMITLVGEILYYRKKEIKEPIQRENIKNVQNFQKTFLDKPHTSINKNTKLILFGTEFKPINKNKGSVEMAHLQLYPRARNRIGQATNENNEKW